MPYFDFKLLSSRTESLPSLFPSQGTAWSCPAIGSSSISIHIQQEEFSPSVSQKSEKVSHPETLLKMSSCLRLVHILYTKVSCLWANHCGWVQGIC